MSRDIYEFTKKALITDATQMVLFVANSIRVGETRSFLRELCDVHELFKGNIQMESLLKLSRTSVRYHLKKQNTVKERRV